MRGRQAVDSILIREARQFQGIAEGLPPRARQKIGALAVQALLLDHLARHADPGSDPWGFWARCYHGITDALAEGWDEALSWAH